MWLVKMQNSLLRALTLPARQGKSRRCAVGGRQRAEGRGEHERARFGFALVRIVGAHDEHARFGGAPGWRKRNDETPPKGGTPALALSGLLWAT